MLLNTPCKTTKRSPRTVRLTQIPRCTRLSRIRQLLQRDLRRQQPRQDTRQVLYTLTMLLSTMVLLSSRVAWRSSNANGVPWINLLSFGGIQRGSACSRTTQKQSGFASTALTLVRHLATRLAGITIRPDAALLIDTVMDRALTRRAATRRRRTKEGVAKDRQVTHGCLGYLVELRLNLYSATRNSTRLIVSDRVEWQALGIPCMELRAYPHLVDEVKPRVAYTDDPIGANLGNVPTIALIIRIRS